MQEKRRTDREDEDGEIVANQESSAEIESEEESNDAEEQQPPVPGEELPQFISPQVPER